MTRRFTFLAALAVAATFATAAQAQSSIITYGQATAAPSFSYSAGGTITINTVINVNVVAPGLLADPMSPTQYNNATFTLTASTMQAAVNGGPSRTQGGFSGSFAITSGSTNILSGTFSSGLLTVVSNSASFSTTDAAFTSDIFVALFNEAFDFTALNLAPKFPGVVGNNFQSFTGQTVAGNFAAIPEPATLAMAGFGVVAMPLAARAIRRRRAA